MKGKRKWLALLLASLLAIGCLVSCGGTDDVSTQNGGTQTGTQQGGAQDGGGTQTGTQNGGVNGGNWSGIHK